MENVNFVPLKDSDMRKSISELLGEATKLKAEIFKTVVMGKEFDEQSLKHFGIYSNEFLRFWGDHADSLNSAMKNVKVDDCDEGIEVLEYGHMKNFIYGHYDYASILHFVDGALKGVNSGDMKKPSELDDYKNHTIDMAFNHQIPSVAGLLDSVLSEELQSMKKKADLLDLKMFDAIRNYTDLFSYRDRPELYKAITKTIEYITTQGVAPKGLDHDNVRLFISLVNNIVEYITYSLTTYAARTFLIYQYATPFITLKHSEALVLESAISMQGISENPNGSICSVFHNTDEMIIKDHKRSKELVDRYVEFLTLIGADVSGFKDPHDGCHPGMDKKWRSGNKLYEKLKDNLLYDFFANSKWYHFNQDKDLNLTEMNHRLKDIMFSKYQGLQGFVTPKNEFITVLQKLEYGATAKDCQSLAKDIAMIAIEVGSKIAQTLNDKSWQLEDELAANNLKLGTRKAIAETIRFLMDLYEELMFAFAQKAGYLERKINELRASEVKKVIAITSLSIPGLKSDLSMADSMMMSAPDTTKVLNEHVDLYSRPIFEAYEMHDMYLRSLPEFANDLYLKEIAEDAPATGTTLQDQIVDTVGTTISSIINKAKAILKALWERIQYFYSSQSFVLAKKWVLENEEKLKSLQFPANAKLEILPYKTDISLPKGFSNLQKNLLTFDEKVLTSADTLQKYLRTLYPSDQVAQWFADDPTGKVSAQKYMNLILFDEGSDKPKPAVVITGADLGKKMEEWINTMKGTDGTKNGFKKINDDIDNAVGSINTKIVNITNQHKADASHQTPPDASKPEELEDPNKPKPTTPPKPDASNQELISQASTKITVTITRLWSPLAPMIIRAMMNQYGYIKAAYNLGQASHQTHTPEGGTPEKGQL